MILRRALLAATTATALAFSAAPAGAQDVDPTPDCGPTFLIGPVACQLEEIGEDPPIVECRVTFVIGPVMCRVENTVRDVLGPDE